MVHVDAILIRQVLINLFDNVSMHASGATLVWLHIRQEGERVLLSVEDDGGGFPRDWRFGALSDPLKTHVQGSASDGRRHMGLGLSVCEAILKAHGSPISFGRSSRHGGAAVKFFLPLSTE